MPKYGRVLFVSRHPGAIEWIKTQDIVVDRFITHLDINDINEGDRVIGSLPVHLASSVCALGAEYWNLSLSVPEEWRGQELSREQLLQLSASLQRFCITHESGWL